MTDPIEIEDDQNDMFTAVSNRDNLYIIHKGKPSKSHSPLTKVNSNPSWPPNLWTTAQLIYDIKKPERNLPPANSPSDTTLRFESRFESGNLSKAYKLAEDSYHLILELDRNKDRACMWFYFGIKNMRKSKTYSFYISGFAKENILFCSGAKIFYYSEKRANEHNISWTHGGTNYGYQITTRLKSNSKRSTLQFQFEFPDDDDEVYFCCALPYTYSDLLRNIENWKKMAKPGVVTSGILCQTLCGRDVPYLEITSPNSSIPLAGKSCIFLTGRIHPGESSGSYVLHGLIDFLLSDHPFANFILDRCIVRIVPMIGIDGVVEGSFRISLMGQDLNRVWDAPNDVMQPVVYQTKSLIKKTAAERPLIVYIDFHGHSKLHGTFAFGCPNPDDIGLRDVEKTLPRLFAFLSEEFSWKNCEFSFPKTRKKAGRIVVRCEIGVVQSFTIEASFGGVSAGRYAGYLYDEILWKKVGADCGIAIYHYLIPTQSPCVSYVNKELDFFGAQNPLGGYNDGKYESADNETDLIFQGKIKGHNDNRHVLVNKSEKLFKFKHHQQLMKVDESQISTTPPKILNPKWRHPALSYVRIQPPS